MSAAADSYWTIYIVRCADDSLYTGVAKDLAARITEHNAGRGAKYTRGRLPVEVVYHETARDRSEAQRREIEIKQMSASDKRALIVGVL